MMIKPALITLAATLLLATAAAFAYTKLKPDLTVINDSDPVVLQINKLSSCFEYPKGSTNQYLCVKTVLDDVSPKQEHKVVTSFASVIVPPIRRK